MKHYHFDVSITFSENSLEEAYTKLKNIMGDCSWETTQAWEEDPKACAGIMKKISDDELYNVAVKIGE